ncbi:MAG: hypothetical protein LC742_00080 [Acidobacteria bacterium]|nr:hypothetical protein [Acidobacteriota bacterium]
MTLKPDAKSNVGAAFLEEVEQEAVATRRYRAALCPDATRFARAARRSPNSPSPD